VCFSNRFSRHLFIDLFFFSLSLTLSSSAHLIRTMTELYESTQSSRLLFPLLGDNNFGQWKQRMSDQLKELDLLWIVSGGEVAPDKDSTDAAVQVPYNKHLRKCFRNTAKIRNAMEPRICAQYTSATYDEDPKSLWEKLEEGYRKALGLELYYFRRSLFDCTFDAYQRAAEYVHEIERIIECLREAEEEIKPREKTFYLLNGLPASWRAWRDHQATILKSDQTLDLITAIKARESTMNRDKGGSMGNDAVLAVRGKGYGYGSSASGSGGASSIAGRVSRQRSNGQPIVCYYCQKKGHRRSECRKLKSETAKGICTDKVTTAAQVVSTDQPENSLFTAFSSTSAPTSRHQWLLNSGCSTHVTGLRDSFTTYEQIPDGEYRIRVANNTEINALSRGDVTLLVWDDGKQCKMELILSGVLHVPACGENSLLSVSQLRRSGIFVELPPSGGATMRYSNGSWVEVKEANELYVLRPMRGEVLGHLGVNKAFAIDTGEGAAKEVARWHFRLAHLGAEAVRRLSLEANDIPSIWKVPRCVCTGCVYGKMTQKPFPSILPSSRATQPLEIIHSDLAGPIDPKSLGGALYLLMFTDD